MLVIEWSIIFFIIFWDFLMFYQFFLSPQVKRWEIIIYKRGIYMLPHELPKEFRLRVLGNWEISVYNVIESWPSARSPYENEKFVNTSKKLLKNRYYTIPVVRCFTWKLELVSNILWMVVGNIPSNEEVTMTTPNLNNSWPFNLNVKSTQNRLDVTSI